MVDIVPVVVIEGQQRRQPTDHLAENWGADDVGIYQEDIE